MPHPETILVGWREWLALPQLGIAAIKAKVDSGARSSALRVDALEEFEQDGCRWLRFDVFAGRRNATRIRCAAPAVDRRAVSDSGGHVTTRWFIRTEFALAGRRWEAEVNLASRRHMLFPLLLGRNALGGFIVDPGAGYRHGRPPGKRQRRTAP